MQQLLAAGQSPWLDYVRKDLFGGELSKWVAAGVRGMTSNPTLFAQAIAKSELYDEDISRLRALGLEVMEIYERLAIADIRSAADTLRPVYEQSGGADGYVSLEVSPLLADDGPATVFEARRLFAAVERPNVMIKVPGTTSGLYAVEELLAGGIPVNVTLLFTMDDWRNTALAHQRAVVRRLEAGQDVTAVASVASVFVSRLDTAYEAWVARQASPSKTLEDLQGRVAIAHARQVYRAFCKQYDAPFARASAAGARPQRPLFASTGTKNNAYSDILYVEALVAEDTVNTLPLATLTAFADHGEARVRLTRAGADAYAQADSEVLRTCEAAGFHLDAVGRELKEQGLRSFAASFAELLDAIRARA